MKDIIEIKNKIKELINFLNNHTYLYDCGKPILTDEEWDKYYFELMNLENKYGIYFPNSPTQAVNYTVSTSLQKVKHNHPLKSLAKTKDWGEFLNYFAKINANKNVIGMPKLDGLTGTLLYQNGKLVRAETRGNGEVGEDITENAKVIKNIPKRINYKDELIVDGEFIITKKDFEPFSAEYANSRNLAAGSIRLLDSKECANRNLTFVVWNVYKGFDDDNSFISRLRKVENIGFTVVPWTSSFDWDATDFLKNKAEELGFDIDGLVGRFDDISYGESLGSTGHHSRAAFAFKFYDEEYETNLRNIEWTMGRTSVLTPVAIFDPVDDGESLVARASLHNISVMKELLDVPYIGQDIKIAKMNQIIPQVVSATKDYQINFDIPLSIPEVCPVCGGLVKVQESDSGVLNLVCENPLCSGKLINILDFFAGKKGLEIKGLSKATLEKLIDWGWISSVEDIFKLKEHEKEWMQKSGFGPKSVSNVLAAIEESKKCDLSRFITAIGIPLIGSTYAKEICRNLDTWEDFVEAATNKFNFSSWNGFGPEMTSSIWKFDFTEANNLSKYLELTNSNKMNNSNSNQEKPLKDLTVVITGKINLFKNRTEFQKFIEENGGKVSSSVSKNTNYLINNDTTSTSSKNLTAQKLGVEIISEKEFLKLFDLEKNN